MNKLLPSLVCLVVLSVCGALGQNDSVTYQQLNELLGIPLWADDNIWDDSDAEAAKRLGWPLEGRTSTLASYRFYPRKEYRVLDSRAYTAVLYAVDQAPSRLSIMFINKGDYPAFLNNSSPNKETIEAFHDALDDESEKMEEKLTDLLGKPERDKLGRGKRLRERFERWDWKGHSILLSVQEEEFVALRVLPPKFLETEGELTEINDRQMREILSSRVVRRDNGDVILKEIPMVNQGPKGYCVPATWERYLRYLGIPADMYALARVGSSGYGGGTALGPIAEAVDDMARNFSRKLDYVDHSLEPDDIADYIDEGLPLMWAVFADNPLYTQVINERTQMRKRVTDWEEWKRKLAGIRQALEENRPARQGGHVCMIIGYNEETGEIATSDSWGPRFTERWMTAEEAQALSMGQMQIIKW